MDRFLIRKDVYDEMIEKGFGKRDYSKLTKKKITDKNGHTRTVYVRNGEQPAEVNQSKAQEGIAPEKKARYEELLKKVKAGPDDNALFVHGEFLNKKDAIAHLEGKLGKKQISSAAQGHLEADEPQYTDITAEDEARFGKQALSGLSGKRTSTEEYKENYLDAKNGAGKDIAENNKINNLSDKIEFSPDEMKMIRDVAAEIDYKVGDEGKLLNSIYSKDRNMYSALTKKNSKAWEESGQKQKTFSSTDLLKEKIQSMNGNFGSDDTKPKINNYVDAHKYLTKLKPTSPELKNDFEDHRDIVLKRIERGQNFEDAIKTYEKEMKISVPHMVESGIMSFEEGNNYIKAWEDLKKQIK